MAVSGGRRRKAFVYAFHQAALLPQQTAREDVYKRQDLQCPESAEHLCGKCEAYAAEWAPIADELWEQEIEKKRKKKEMVH